MKQLLFVMLIALPLAAQEFRGKIAGRALDASGAVIVGVRVRATNTETGVVTSAQSNERGNYEIPFLLPGTYDVSAEFVGFKQYARKGVTVRIEDQVLIDIALEPGTHAETVTVTAEVPLLEQSLSAGQVVDNRMVTELPLQGGNAYGATQLNSDVVYFGQPNHPTGSASVEVASNIGMSGTRSGNTEFSLDGAPSMWGANTSFVPPPEMVSEFRIQTSRYDASVGRGAGGAVNVALRSGTNELHVSLAEWHNNIALQSLDFFQRQYLYDPSSGPVTDAKKKSLRAGHTFNRVTSTIGGPVILPRLYDGRNRTFWIYGFESSFRVSTDFGAYYHTVPTVRQRQGDFSQLLAIGPTYQIYDPATIAALPDGRYARQPFAGNLIPRTRFDRTAQLFLEQWPLPNLSGSASGENNYFRPGPTYAEYFAHIGRLDHIFSEKLRVFGRYHQSQQLWDSQHWFPNDATGNIRWRRGRGVGLDAVYLVSPTVLVNLRYSLARFVQSFAPPSAGFDLVAAGFPAKMVSQIDPRGIKMPTITVDTYRPLSSLAPSVGSSLYHTWAGDVTRIRGNHSLRVGVDFRLYREFIYDFTSATPSLAFAGTWTKGPYDTSSAAPMGQGLASFLLGLPTSGSIVANASAAEQSPFAAAFVQEEWKVSPRMTISAGLRYEFEPSVTERFDRSVRGFDLTAHSPVEAAARAAYAASPIPQLATADFRALGGLTFAGADKQPRSLWESDRANFAPRAGIAWRLPRNWLVRAGYGLFYFPAGADRADVSQRGFSRTTSLVSSLDNGLTYSATFANPFPDGFAAPLGAAGGLATDLGRAITYFNPDRPHGYTQRWSFTVQKQAARWLLVEASYTGTFGSRLSVATDINAVPRQYLSTLPTRDATTINLLTGQVNNPFYPLLPGTDLGSRTVARQQLLRPYPQFSGITTTQPVGYSRHHAASTRVERRMRGGIGLQANYTWSKFLEATSRLNASDPDPERVISDQDRAHRFVASGILELPFGKGKRFANWNGVAGKIAGGWQFQTIYQGQSGSPLGFGGVIYYGDIHSIPLPASQRRVTRWFNTDNFERSSARQLASNIRAFSTRFTGVRGPGLNIWNASLTKNLRIREKYRFMLRAESLNATGHTVFSNPNTSVTSTLFGVVSSNAGWPRLYTLTAKVQF
jgi:hypothetical protein